MVTLSLVGRACRSLDQMHALLLGVVEELLGGLVKEISKEKGVAVGFIFKSPFGHTEWQHNFKHLVLASQDL